MFFPLFTLSPSTSPSSSCLPRAVKKGWQKEEQAFRRGPDSLRSPIPPGLWTFPYTFCVAGGTRHLCFPSSALLQPCLSCYGCSSHALPYVWPPQYAPRLFCMALTHPPSINSAFRIPHSTHHYFKREYHSWNTLLPFMIAGSMCESFSFSLFISPHEILIYHY